MIKAGIVGLGRWGRILVEATVGSRDISFVKGTTRTLANAQAFAVRRFSRLETEDTTSVSMQLENGATASLMCSIVAPLSYRFTVIGTKGIASVSTPGLDRFRWQALDDGEPKSTITSGFDTVRAELEAFAQAIKSGGDYRISHDEMIHGAAVLEATIRSAGQGKPVEVA